MFARRQQHGFADSLEFIDVSQELVVNENCRAIRIDRKLQLAGCSGRGLASIFLHGESNDVDLPRLKRGLFHVVLVPGLPRNDLVFARQQQNFLVAGQFFCITKILTVDPDAGIFFRITSCGETNFREHAAISGTHGERAEQNHSSDQQTFIGRHRKPPKAKE